MGIIKIRSSNYLGSVAEVERVRRELLKAGNNYISRGRQYRKLFNLYRKKLGLSGPGAKIKVAQVAESGALDHVLAKLENEEPLRPVIASSETLGEYRRRRIKRKK